MRTGRTILAFLLAISVASLPVAGHAMLRANPQDISGAAATEDMSAMPGADHMSASADMDMGCCPHDGDRSDKPMGGCAAMAACGLCFTMSAGPSSPIIFLMAAAGIDPSFVTYVYRSPPGHPPFRPPRI